MILKPSTILALLFFVFSLSCKKDGNKLTPETQIGANTFSCKINGIVFIPNESLFTPKAILVFNDLNSPTNPSLRIEAGAYKPELNQIIEVLVYSKISAGTYYFPDNNNSKATYTIGGNLGDPVYTTGTDATGHTTFTKVDYNARICSGTFAFTGKTSGGETVSVTDGRFDITF